MAVQQDNSSSEEPCSFRMQYFLKVLEKALKEVVDSVDTDKAVNECYGQDASIFSGKTSPLREDSAEEGTSEVNMLSNLIKETIFKINERVKSEIITVLEKEEVNEKLLNLERLLEEFEESEKKHQLMEEKDKKETQEVLDNVLNIPVGLSPLDLIKHHEYKLKLKEKDHLLSEIASLEAETELIEVQIKKGNSIIKTKLEEISEKGEQISRTANICSHSLS